MSRLLLAAGLGLLLVFAYLTAIHSAFVLFYGLALIGLLAWFWARQAARGLQVDRSIEAGTPTVGEAFEESFTVSKSGWVPAPWVEVSDLSDLPGYRPGRVISLGDPVTWNANGTYRRRGWTVFGPTRVKVKEPFGLFHREVRLPDRHRILVYPRIRPMPDFVIPAHQHSGDAPPLASAEADGELPIWAPQIWERVRRIPGRMIALITPSTDASWIANLEALPGRRTARVAFYVDAASFGAPEPHLTFELHTDVELYVVRK